MRRVLGDALISAGTVLVLLVVLVSIDERVRDRVSALATPSRSGIVSVGTQVSDVSRAVFDAARYQSVEHAPMMIFAVAATVLVLFMLRT
jgi:hypothetical protein